MRASNLRRLLNIWPPFLVNSIRVTHIAQDWTSATVRLRLRFWNQNYVRTQFGGNLFAMTDPIKVATRVSELVVRRSDGTVSRRRNVPADRIVTLD